MPNKKTIYCNNPSVGRFLPEAKSGALIERSREEDRRVFFDEHLHKCPYCRDEMIDHASQLALYEVAEANKAEVDEIVDELAKAAQQLRDIARHEGITFEEVVLATLRGHRQMTTHSFRLASSVVTTEP